MKYRLLKHKSHISKNCVISRNLNTMVHVIQDGAVKCLARIYLLLLFFFKKHPKMKVIFRPVAGGNVSIIG